MAAAKSLADILKQVRELGAHYLGRVYPGEKPDFWPYSTPRPGDAPKETTQGAATRSALAVMMSDKSVTWTNMDEIDAPRQVHGAWAQVLTHEVPDWKRENVQIYPFATGQRVNLPGDKPEDMDVQGFVVEQTGMGTTLDGKPYRVSVCHVMFVKDGKVIRNNQYWGSADPNSQALNIRTLDATRGEYRRQMSTKKGRGAP